MDGQNSMELASSLYTLAMAIIALAITGEAVGHILVRWYLGLVQWLHRRESP